MAMRPEPCGLYRGETRCATRLSGIQIGVNSMIGGFYDENAAMPPHPDCVPGLERAKAQFACTAGRFSIFQFWSSRHPMRRQTVSGSAEECPAFLIPGVHGWMLSSKRCAGRWSRWGPGRSGRRPPGPRSGKQRSTRWPPARRRNRWLSRSLTRFVCCSWMPHRGRCRCFSMSKMYQHLRQNDKTMIDHVFDRPWVGAAHMRVRLSTQLGVA